MYSAEGLVPKDPLPKWGCGYLNKLHLRALIPMPPITAAS